MKFTAKILLFFYFALCSVVGGIWAGGLLNYRNLVGIDDANIFFTYARNILANGEITWITGGDRVEGFTSILWLVLVCLAELLRHTEIILLAANIIILTLANYCLFAKFSELFAIKFGTSLESWLLLVLYTAITYSSLPYLGWVVSTLMDTGLWSLMLILSVLAAYNLANAPSRRNSIVFSLTSVVLPLTRPEGMLLAFALVLLVFIVLYSIKPAWKYLFFPVLLLLLTVAALTLFRIWYFSYPFPNTYYAKVGTNLMYNLEQGVDYFIKWIALTKIAYLFLTAILAGLVIYPYRRFRCQVSSPGEMFFFLESVFLIGYFFIYIYVGGDHFSYTRHYQAILPMSVLNLLVAINLLPGVERRLRLSLLSLLGVYSLIGHPNLQPRESFYLKYEFTLSEYGRSAAETLNRYFPQKPLVSAIAVGSLSYVYSGPVFDIMGLNDLVVAHSRSERHGLKNHAAFSKKIFMQRRPDLLIHFGYTCKAKKSLRSDAYINDMLKRIPEDTDFKSQYLPFWVPDTSMLQPQYGVCGYVRKDFYQKSRDSVPYEILEE